MQKWLRLRLLLVFVLAFVQFETTARGQIPPTTGETFSVDTKAGIARFDVSSSTGEFDVGELTDHCYQFNGTARAFYLTDQRIQWTGQEETFGVEGVLGGSVMRSINGWDVGVEAELFITQPYDRNILVDTPERISYRGNFDYEALEISQLFFEASQGDFSISLGKRRTPFGRTWFQIHTNRQFDAPFVRTEVINWRETGLQLDFTPDVWEMMFSIVNGSEELDTNSMKSAIARIGIHGDRYALGMSAKWHDGVGSEGQKYRKNHVGFDGMIRCGGWQLSSEVVYDEYGFRRPFNPLDITWGRSIYNRDQFSHDLLRGIGYYINLNHHNDHRTLLLNYGMYHPLITSGDAIHDRDTHRGYAKYIRHFGPGLDSVTTVLLENEVPNAQSGQTRKGFMIYTGVEYRF